MPIQLKQPLIITGGTGVTASNSGVAFDGTQQIIQQISIGQDIAVTDNVQFNSITASSWKFGDDISIYDNGQVLGSVTHTGTTSISSTLSINGNATITGKITAEEIISELTSSGTIFKSGSTQFGDTLDDTHYITGSLYDSGSFVLNGGSSNEISNDGLLGDNSQVAIITEGAVKTYADTNIGTTIVEPYLRKNYNKTALSITNNTASFSAFTASAPDGITATNETDFLFFNNGQIMEHDALTIQQSGSNFLLLIDPAGIGYTLESSDEIKSWGKFETTGYLKFDGLTNEVITTFSGSGATPVNRTYSWWMNASETGSNQGVFGYGSSKREAFLINISQSSVLKPLFRLATHLYKYFMTPGHEEEGGGTSGNGDSGANEGTAHISAQDDGNWHHWMLFTGASDPQSSSLYIDGVEQDTAKFANTGTIYTQQDSLSIGTVDSGTTEGEHFSGSLKEFSVFPGDKTSKASIYYNNGTPYDVTNEDDLQGYWKMNENNGSIAYDYSGKGNHGTIDGATWGT